MGVRASKPTNADGWAGLPPELLDLVLRRLSSYADRRRFAFVCRHWCRTAWQYPRSLPLPRELPWLNFCDGTFQSLPDGELHSLRFKVDDDARCVGSYQNWLVFENKKATSRRCRYFLKNPMTGATRQLPSRCNWPASCLQRNPSDDHHDGRGSTDDFTIDKVVVCSDDLIAANVWFGRQRLDVVVCFRPGVSSSWCTGLWNGRQHEDMAFHKGKLYTVTVEGDLFEHDVAVDRRTGEPRVCWLERVIRAPSSLLALEGAYYGALDGVRVCYLVSSRTGKLLMVRWIVPDDAKKQMTLKVFEADMDKSRWVEVEDIGDQVLFVSSDSSRAITASLHKHSGCMLRNKIYFLDDRLLFWPTRASRNQRTCGVYDMSSKTIHPMLLGGVHVSDQANAVWLFV